MAGEFPRVMSSARVPAPGIVHGVFGVSLLVLLAKMLVLSSDGGAPASEALPLLATGLAWLWMLAVCRLGGARPPCRAPAIDDSVPGGGGEP